MFSAIFPIENKYVVFNSIDDIFEDMEGHCGIESLYCKLDEMSILLQQNDIKMDHIINKDSLIFLYFSTLGTFKVFGDVSVNNCVVELKSLGPKICLRSFAIKTKSRYTRRSLQPAQ